jgi:hypothetical protein
MRLLCLIQKRDIAWFNAENKIWNQKEKDLDTLVQLLTQATTASDKQVLQKLLSINYVSDATMNTATYNQMKTSGSLRYINDLKLIAELEEYYEIKLPRVIESSQSTKAFFNEYIKTFFIDHLRNQDMEDDSVAASNYNPVIIGRSRDVDQRLSNIINMDRELQQISNNFYESANKKAAELITLLQKEYHLNNE